MFLVAVISWNGSVIPVLESAPLSGAHLRANSTGTGPRDAATSSTHDDANLSVLRLAPNAFNVALNGSKNSWSNLSSAPGASTASMLACVGVCSASARRGVSGLAGDMEIASSSCTLAALMPLQPMRLRRAPLGDRGEAGDNNVVPTQVDDTLRISVRRGNKGEDGVGDLLVSTKCTVAEGERVQDAECLSTGEMGSDIAERRRATELVVRHEQALDVVEDRL